MTSFTTVSNGTPWYKHVVTMVYRGINIFIPGYHTIYHDVKVVYHGKTCSYWKTTMEGFHALCGFDVIAALTARLAAWLSGSALASINKVTLRRARLVLGWVTVCGLVNHLGL